jgi:hypothetical protein
MAGLRILPSLPGLPLPRLIGRTPCSRIQGASEDWARGTLRDSDLPTCPVSPRFVQPSFQRQSQRSNAHIAQPTHRTPWAPRFLNNSTVPEGAPLHVHQCTYLAGRAHSAAIRVRHARSSNKYIGSRNGCGRCSRSICAAVRNGFLPNSAAPP